MRENEGVGEKIKPVNRNMSCTSKWVIFTLNFNTKYPDYDAWLN